MHNLRYTLFFYCALGLLFMYTLNYYPANPSDATHRVVGTENTDEGTNVDTLNIRVEHNRVTLSLGTNHAERHSSITTLLRARNMPITYIPEEFYFPQLCLASTCSYAYGDRNIANRLDFINVCLFEGNISTEYMTILRAVAGVPVIEAYTVNYFPPLPSFAWLLVHSIVGRIGVHEDTLTVTIRNDHTLSIHAGTNHLRRLNQITSLFEQHGLHVTYEVELPDAIEGYITHAFHSHYGHDDIANHLDMINRIIFGNQISSELMTTLRTVTGASTSITTLEDRVEAMDISPTPPQQ
jgi:hypothetical protein